MGKQLLSKTQLRDMLGRKLRLLRKDCVAYDQGDDDQVEAMAVILRTLWSAGQGNCLIERLAATKKCLDGTFQCPPNVVQSGEEPVLERRAYVLSENRDYAPCFFNQSPASQLPVDEWWEQEVVRDDRSKSLSRRDVVLLVADKEGAHVDDELSKPEFRLRYESGAGLSRGEPISEGKFHLRHMTPIPAIIRQIAFETLQTLDPHPEDDGSAHYISPIAFASFTITPA